MGELADAIARVQARRSPPKPIPPGTYPVPQALAAPDPSTPPLPGEMIEKGIKLVPDRFGEVGPMARAGFKHSMPATFLRQGEAAGQAAAWVSGKLESAAEGVPGLGGIAETHRRRREAYERGARSYGERAARHEHLASLQRAKGEGSVLEEAAMQAGALPGTIAQLIGLSKYLKGPELAFFTQTFLSEVTRLGPEDALKHAAMAMATGRALREVHGAPVGTQVGALTGIGAGQTALEPGVTPEEVVAGGAVFGAFPLVNVAGRPIAEPLARRMRRRRAARPQETAKPTKEEAAARVEPEKQGEANVRALQQAQERVAKGEEAPPSLREDPVPAPGPGGVVASMDGQTVVKIPGKAALPASYRFVEARDVKTSHDPITFRESADYQGANERDYTKPENFRRVEQHTEPGREEFDPDFYLTDLKTIEHGPTVVDQRGDTHGGTRRMLVLKRIYAGLGEPIGWTPARLKAEMVRHARRFGRDPAEAEGMEQPVLVREVQAPEGLEAKLEFSRLLNQNFTAQTSRAERAVSMAASLRESIPAFANSVARAPEDLPTIRKAIRNDRELPLALERDGLITDLNRSRWVDPDSKTLTLEAMDLVEDMLLARVVPDKRVIQAMSHRDKVLRAIPSLLSVEADHPGAILPKMAGAIRSEITRQREGVPIQRFLEQRALGEATGIAPSQADPQTARLHELLVRESGNKLKQRMSLFLSRMREIGQVKLGLPEMSQGRAFADAFGTREASSADLAQPARPSSEIPSRTAPEGIPSEARRSGEAGGETITARGPSEASVQPAVPQTSTKALPSSATSRRTELPVQAGPASSLRAIGEVDPATGIQTLQEPGLSISQLASRAAEVKPQMDALLGEVVAEIPGARIWGSRAKIDRTMSGEEVVAKLARIEQKMRDGPGGSQLAPWEISDYLGARIEVPHPESAQVLAERLGARTRIISDDPFWDHPKGGYRGRHLQIEVPGRGISAEIQIGVPESIAIQERAHLAYERYRDPGRYSQAEVEAAIAESERIHGQAWDAYLRRRLEEGRGEIPGLAEERPVRLGVPQPPAELPPAAPPPIAQPPPMQAPPPGAAGGGAAAPQLEAKVRRFTQRDAEGIPLPKPDKLTSADVEALLEEIHARKGGRVEDAVSELLTASDWTIGENAEALLPGLVRYYEKQRVAAARGVQSDANRLALAEELGLSEAELLRRRPGTVPNDAEVTAMRDLNDRAQARLAEKAERARNGTPQDKADFAREFQLAGALYAQYRGGVAEIGRAMRALRSWGNAERAHGKPLMRMDVEELDRLFGAQFGDQQAVDLLLKKYDELRTDQYRQRRFTNKASEVRTWDKVMEVYKAVLLSGPRTFMRNLFGFTNFWLTEVPAVALMPTARRLHNVKQRLRGAQPDLSPTGGGFRESALLAGGSVAAAIPRRAMTRAVESGLLPKAFGDAMAARDALDIFWHTLMGHAKPEHGPVRRVLDLPRRAFLTEREGPVAMPEETLGVELPILTRTEGIAGGAISNRIAGPLIRGPFRGLNAVDAAAETAFARGKLWQLAYRDAYNKGHRGQRAIDHMGEFMREAPEWAKKEASKFAQRMAFVSPLGPAGQSFRQWVRRFKAPEVIFAFQRAPINIWKSYARTVPGMSKLMSEVREDYAAGGTRRDMAKARTYMGGALAMMTLTMAARGFITGAGPSDPQQRKLMEELGWKPYSFKVPGWTIGSDKPWVYIGYRGMEPGSTHFGIAADIAENFAELSNEEAELSITRFVQSFINNAADQSFLFAPANAAKAFSGHEGDMDRFVRQLVTSPIPRALSPFAEMADPYIRDSRSVLNEVQRRLGIAEHSFGPLDRLPPRLTAWGQFVRRDPNLGPDVISPFRLSEAREDKTTSEALELGVRISPMDRKMGDVELNPWQWTEMDGTWRRNTKRHMDLLVQQPQWDAMPKIARREVFETVMRSYRDMARLQTLGRMKRAERVRAILDRDLRELLSLEGESR